VKLNRDVAAKNGEKLVAAGGNVFSAALTKAGRDGGVDGADKVGVLGFVQLECNLKGAEKGLVGRGDEMLEELGHSGRLLEEMVALTDG
jgi:hypothetical protein